MTIQQPHAVHRAAPFYPLTVHVADGCSFHVPHPDFLSMSPTVRTVIIDQQNDEFSTLDLILMTEIQTVKATGLRIWAYYFELRECDTLRIWEWLALSNSNRSRMTRLRQESANQLV